MTIIFSNSVLMGIFNAVEILSGLSTPLILIIIGYGLKVNKKYNNQSVKLVFLRTLLILFFGYLFKFGIIDVLIETDTIFDYAYFNITIAVILVIIY